MAHRHDIGHYTTAPTLADLEAVAREAFAGIPAELRRFAGNVVIRVEDFPDDETLEDMECETPFDLLGLYRGVDLSCKSVLDAPEDLDLIASRTTRNLIITVEQIVTHERVRQLPYLNLIPRFRTTAVVELPYGAHPFSCLHVYDQDRDHLSHYAQVGRNPDSFQDYLNTYVYGVTCHADYLNLIGAARLASLRQIGAGL